MDQYAEVRERMVREQIEARDVRSGAVLDAMRAVPRHRFVPPGLAHRAYEDHPIAIGHGQTISQPYIVARMTELLDLKPAHRVLEIGTGSGYQAAVLARLAREVFSIEIVPDLSRSAAALFRDLGIENIAVRLGDGYRGWPEKAPFDRIILTAAPPEIPAELTRQLAPGGRLVAPEGEGDRQHLILIDKRRDGSLRRTTGIPVRFVPMVPGRQAQAQEGTNLHP